MVAASNGNAGLTKKLIESGANIEIKDKVFCRVIFLTIDLKPAIDWTDSFRIGKER